LSSNCAGTSWSITSLHTLLQNAFSTVAIALGFRLAFHFGIWKFWYSIEVARKVVDMGIFYVKISRWGALTLKRSTAGLEKGLREHRI